MTVALLSCVVAAFNAQRTLARTLGSLAATRRHEDLEVLIIDDGSTDETAVIAQAFCGAHVGFRLIRQENRGLGAVRNRGLAEARGLYVTFCDADDIFLPDNQLELADRMERKAADIGVGHGFSLLEGSTITDFWDSHWVRGLASPNAALPDDFRHLLQPTACTKLFRRGFALGQGLRFSEGRLFEDVEFTCSALLETRRIVYANLPMFIYDVHGNGSITSSRSMRRFEIFDNLRCVFDRAREHVSPGIEATCLATSLVRTALWCLDNVPETAVQAFEIELVKTFREFAPQGDLAALAAVFERLTDHWDKRALETLSLLWWTEADEVTCYRHLERVRVRPQGL
jgi:CDP-glycerol glycerophosphotransferase